MKKITIRLPDDYKSKLDALAHQERVTPTIFARQKLMEAIEDMEHARHRSAMEEMVRQAIAYQEIRDRALEKCSLAAMGREVF